MLIRGKMLPSAARHWGYLWLRVGVLGFGFWGPGFGWVFGLGFRFGVLGFGVWGLGFGFWVLGFGFWVLGFGFWGLGVGIGVWGLKVGLELTVEGLGVVRLCEEREFRLPIFGFTVKGSEFRWIRGSGVRV